MSKIFNFEKFLSFVEINENISAVPPGFVKTQWSQVGKEPLNAENISYAGEGWTVYQPGSWSQLSAKAFTSPGIASDKVEDYEDPDDGIVAVNLVLYKGQGAAFWFGQPVQAESLQEKDSSCLFGKDYIIIVPFSGADKEAKIAKGTELSDEFYNPRLISTSVSPNVNLIRSICNINDPIGNSLIKNKMTSNINNQIDFKYYVDMGFKGLKDVIKQKEELLRNPTGKFLADSVMNLATKPVNDIKAVFSAALLGDPAAYLEEPNFVKVFDETPWATLKSA